MCATLYSLNSHAYTPPTILDRDARRLVKRPKLSHPRLGMLHETELLSVGSQSGVAPQHMGKAGRRQVDQSLPRLKGRSGGDEPYVATTAAITSGKLGKNRDMGRSRLRPMGLVGGSGANQNEVRTVSSSPFPSWAGAGLRAKICFRF